MADLGSVFADLRAIMAPYAARLDSKKDDDTELYVDTKHIQKNKKPLFFGAVQIKKSFVSFHLRIRALSNQAAGNASRRCQRRRHAA